MNMKKFEVIWVSEDAKGIIRKLADETMVSMEGELILWKISLEK